MAKMKCTNRDYVKFIGYCRDHARDLRLSHWNIDYKFANKDTDHVALCSYDLNTWSATITLYADWSPENTVTDRTLSEAAYHELLHLVLAEIMAHTPDDQRSLWHNQEHEIIKRLCLAKFRKHK